MARITAPGRDSKPVYNLELYKSQVGGDADDYSDAFDAILAAVASPLSGVAGGVIHAPGGLVGKTYELQSSLANWPDNVSIVGDGPGRTIFKPIGAIRFLEATRTSGTPLTGCVFRDFEVDGSQQTGATSKGFHIQHYTSCRWENLYVHDCGFTGIGPDHPQADNVIAFCTVENNGRLNDGTQSSGNGIGVGMGATTSEQPLLIIGNTAIGNKRYNILVESQSGVASQLCSGVRIVDNYCSGGQVGIGDCGSRRTIIADNQVTGASVAGISVDEGTFSGGQPGYQGQISDNVCYLNTGDGIRLDYSVGTVIGCQTTVKDNECAFNTGRGIHVLSATQDIFDLVMTDNVCRFNARTGILLALTGAATAQLRWSVLKDNVCLCNGTASSASDGDGIRCNMIVNDTTIDGNRCFDRQGTKTQDRGIHLNAAVNGGSIRGNDVRNNQTGGMHIGGALSATTAVSGNLGYTPPAPAAPASGPVTSPWSFTQGEAPEWLFLYGGDVTSVSLGGVQVAASTGCCLPLEPGDTVSVAWTTTPPTARTRKR